MNFSWDFYLLVILLVFFWLYYFIARQQGKRQAELKFLLKIAWLLTVFCALSMGLNYYIK